MQETCNSVLYWHLCCIPVCQIVGSLMHHFVEFGGCGYLIAVGRTVLRVFLCTS